MKDGDKLRAEWTTVRWSGNNRAKVDTGDKMQQYIAQLEAELEEARNIAIQATIDEHAYKQLEAENEALVAYARKAKSLEWLLGSLGAAKSLRDAGPDFDHFVNEWYNLPEHIRKETILEDGEEFELG